MTKEKKWTHNELAHDLAEHLRGTRDLLAWEDMQLGPSGSPRPDVFTINTSYSRFTPIAYECKVSVSDFRRDVTAGKWQSYLKFAGAVIFAVPAGLVSKEEIPPGCGLIVRHESGWRRAKGPTMAHMQTLPREAWMKLLIDGVMREVNRRLIQARGRANSYLTEQALGKRHGKEVAALVGMALRNKEILTYAIEQDEIKRREIVDGTERFAKLHRERLETRLQNLTGEQQYLARSLGLAEDASIDDLCRAVRAATARLREDAEIERLRGLFAEVKRCAEKGLDPLPGEPA